MTSKPSFVPCAVFAGILIMLLAPVIGTAQSQSDSSASPGQAGSDGIGAIIVEEVVPDGPAALGGVKVGDFITKVEGEKVRGLLQVVLNVVVNHKPGDTIALSVFRRADKKEIDLIVTLGQNPDNAPKAWLGIVAREWRFQSQEPKGNPGTQSPSSVPGRNASTL